MVAAKSRPQYDPKDVINVEDEYLKEHRHRFDPPMEKSPSSWYQQPGSGTMHNDYRQEGDVQFNDRQFHGEYRIEEKDGISGYRIKEEKGKGGNHVYRIEEEEIRSNWRKPPGGGRHKTYDVERRKFLDEDKSKKKGENEDDSFVEILEHGFDHVEKEEAIQKDSRSSSKNGTKKIKKTNKREGKLKQKVDIPVVETVEEHSFDEMEEADEKRKFKKEPPVDNCAGATKLEDKDSDENDHKATSLIDIVAKNMRNGFSKFEQDDENDEGKERGTVEQGNESRLWFTSIMTSIFNPENSKEEEYEEKTNDDTEVPWHFIPCGRLSSNGMRGGSSATSMCKAPCSETGCTGSDQQGCNAIDLDTYSLANSANDFGDLQSIPSLEDSIIHKAGGGDELLSDTTSKEFNGPMLIKKLAELQKREEMERADGKSIDENDTSGNDDTLLKLTKELSEAQQRDGQFCIETAPILVSIAALFAEKKDFTTALNIEQQVVSIYSTKLGDSDDRALEAKLRCAKALENVGNYSDAIEMYCGVISMWKALKDEKKKIADILLLIAHSLRLKGQFMEAIRELKRALKLYRECLGDAHESVASTVDEIASLYVTLGDFEKSAAILEEVVKLKAATLGMSNAKVSQSLVDLATSYECSENFELAIKALKKAYKIYTDLGGFSCEEATSTLQRIALIYQASNDMNKAGIAYLGVLRGKKHLLGDDHLDVAETYYRLGVCLRETKQLDKSLKCMKEALPILVGKGKAIADVEMIAEVMHEMALLYKSKGTLSEAARIFKQELTVRRKIGQPEYPCIANTLNHLGVTEYEMKLHKRAMKHLLEVLTIFQEQSEQGIDFAEALFNIGLVFEALKNKERAYEAFLEASRVFKRNGYSKEHPHLVKAINKVKRLAR